MILKELINLRSFVVECDGLFYGKHGYQTTKHTVNREKVNRPTYTFDIGGETRFNLPAAEINMIAIYEMPLDWIYRGGFVCSDCVEEVFGKKI